MSRKTATLIASLRELLARATPGPWQLQDGCSWRRIGTAGRDGNVLCPSTYSRDDNHPDLTAGKGEDLYANLRLIVAAVNALPTLLDTLTNSAGLNEDHNPDGFRHASPEVESKIREAVHAYFDGETSPLQVSEKTDKSKISDDLSTTPPSDGPGTYWLEEVLRRNGTECPTCGALGRLGIIEDRAKAATPPSDGSGTLDEDVQRVARAIFTHFNGARFVYDTAFEKPVADGISRGQAFDLASTAIAALASRTIGQAGWELPEAQEALSETVAEMADPSVKYRPLSEFREKVRYRIGWNEARDAAADTKPARSKGNPPDGKWGGMYQVAWDDAVIAYEEAIRALQPPGDR